MEKKIVAYFTIVSLIFFVFSCYTIKKISPASGKENQKVYALKTKAGEYLKFKKENPVVIQQGSIKLKKNIEQVIEIERKNIKKLHENSQGDIITIETNDGKYYFVREILSKDSEKIKVKVKTLLLSEELVLPLAEIQALWIKRISWWEAIAVTAIAVVITVIILNTGKKEPAPPPPPTPPTNWD